MRYKYYAVVQDSNGNIISGASVSVYLAGTTTPANVYISPSGSTGSNTPPQVTSSGDGVIEFWLEHSEYSYGQLFKLVIQSNTLTKTIDNVQIINWATTPYTVDATGAVTGQLVQFDTANTKLRAVPVYYNSSSGNVGIGTTSPQMTLHVSSSGNTGVRIDAPSSQQVGCQLAKDGSVKWSMYIDANSSDLRFWDGTATRVIFASGGNVGIGTTAPAGKLDVAGVFYTDTGTIKVRPQNNTVEGGEIELFGAGSYGTTIIDNYYGRLRLWTASGTSTFVGVVVDPSGNVGIGGDFAPSYKLHVLGNIAIQAGANAFVGTVDNYQLSLRTNNTDRVIIDTSGRVGLGGITSPQANIHIGGGESIYFGGGGNTYPTTPSSGSGALVGKSGTSDFRLVLQDGTGRVNMYWNAYWDSSASAWKYIVSNEPACRFLEQINGTTGCYFGFYGAPAGTAGNTISWTQVAELASGADVWLSPRGTSSDFFINSSGTVGIGTTSPSGKLEVYGGYIFSNEAESGAGKLRVGAAWGYPGLYVETANKDLVFGTNSGGIRFVPSGNTRVYITPSGNVGIGTTTPGIASLNIANQGSGVGLYIGDVNTAPYGNALIELNPPASATHIWVQEGSQRVFSVTAGGAGFFAGKLEVAGSFYTATGEIRIYPQNNTTEGGQLTLLGAGSYGYYYIDNCAGQFRIIGSGEVGRFIIDSNGNVAIGGFTPSCKLDVGGSIRSISSGYVYIYPASSDSEQSHISIVNTASTTNNPFLNFGYGSYVGICSVYMAISDKSLRLNVSKTSDGQNLRDAIIIPPANNSPTGCIIPAPAGGNYTDWPSGWAGGISTWDICCSGIYYTTMNQRSDANIKTDVQPLSDYLQTDCLDIISCLKPIKYVYVDDPLKINRFGFIAQDVSEVCPELVAVDTEGKASLNYMDLIAVLTRGIQELYGMLEKVIQKIGGIS